jgi:hypothetical protein
MADPATDVPGFDDYSAALDRMGRATDAGQEPTPGDIDIFRRGYGTHRDAYNAAQAQPSPSLAAPPRPPLRPGERTLSDLITGAPPQPPTDPNSWTNIGLRGVTNALGVPADFSASALNAAKAGYERLGGTSWAPQIALRSDATPAEREWAASVNATNAPGGRLGMPTQVLRAAAGIPEMGPNASIAQQLGEAAIPILAGSAPAAASAGKAAAKGFMPTAEAVVTSLAKNAVLAPAASVAGGALGQKLGGEPGAFVGGLAAPLAATAILPQAAARLSAMVHKGIWQAPETPYGEQVQIPGAKEVTSAADELGIQPRFGMLATLGGKKMEGAIGSLGFTPASRAMEQDRPMFEDQAAKLLEARRALPDATPETLGLIVAAHGARNSQISRGVLPNQATSIPAVEQYMANRMGGDFPVDVTNTANALADMYHGGTMQQITPSMRAAIADRYNQLTTPATGIGDAGDGIASHITPDGRIFAPWSLVRGWRSGLGQQTQKAIGMQGPQLDQTYGAITGDMKAAAAGRGLSPAEFDAAMAIERGEKGAQVLKEQLLDPTLLNRKATYAADFGARMQKLYEDPDVFKKTMGGRYESQEAPMPNEPGGMGAGDIRRQAYNLGVLGRSSYMPPEQTGQMQALWRGAKQLVLPGIGGLLGSLSGNPTAGTAIGGIANYLRSGLMESPVTRDIMMGRDVPWARTPSLTPSQAAATQQDNIRRALGGGASPPEQSTPGRPPWSPYSPPQPGVVPKRPWSPYSALPTTQGILAAWNRANVGNPRSRTAA